MTVFSGTIQTQPADRPRAEGRPAPCKVRRALTAGPVVLIAIALAASISAPHRARAEASDHLATSPLNSAAPDISELVGELPPALPMEWILWAGRPKPNGFDSAPTLPRRSSPSTQVSATTAPKRADSATTSSPPAVAAPQHGTIRVVSTPGSVAVWVDDTYVGRTPLSLSVTPGWHDISSAPSTADTPEFFDHVNASAGATQQVTIRTVAPAPAPPRRAAEVAHQPPDRTVDGSADQGRGRGSPEGSGDRRAVTPSGREGAGRTRYGLAKESGGLHGETPSEGDARTADGNSNDSDAAPYRPHGSDLVGDAPDDDASDDDAEAAADESDAPSAGTAPPRRSSASSRARAAAQTSDKPVDWLGWMPPEPYRKRAVIEIGIASVAGIVAVTTGVAAATWGAEGERKRTLFDEAPDNRRAQYADYEGALQASAVATTVCVLTTLTGAAAGVLAWADWNDLPLHPTIDVYRDRTIVGLSGRW